MKKTAIIILLFLLTFPSLAGFSKVGGFFFKGKQFGIEKNGKEFRVVSEGKVVASFSSLYSYSSNGEDRVCFLTENSETVWVKDKVYSFKIKLNPVLRLREISFLPLFSKDGRFAFVGDKEPYVLDTLNGDVYRVPFLFFKKRNALKLVFPQEMVFTEGCFVYFAEGKIFVFSLKENRIVLAKKTDFSFLTYSVREDNSAYLLFDYKFPVRVFPEKGEVVFYPKLKKKKVVYKGKMGEIKNCTVTAEVSNSGFSEEIVVKVDVYSNKKLIFEKRDLKIKVNLNEIKIMKPFVFFKYEKAVLLNFPGCFLIVSFPPNKKPNLSLVGKDKKFSIVNGRVEFF